MGLSDRFSGSCMFSAHLKAGILTAMGIELRSDAVPMTIGSDGLFEVSRGVPVGRAIEDRLLIAECSLPGEWEGQVRYLPLR